MKTLLFLAMMIGAFSAQAKGEDSVNSCFNGRCILAVITGNEYTFYTADAGKFQELKSVDKSFPIKLTSQEYYAQTSAKSPTVEYTDAEIDRLGEDLEDSGTLCRVGVISCVASSAWFAIDVLVKKDFVSAPFSFITAVATCSGSYIQCKDYWRKYDAYKKAYNSKHGLDDNGRPIIEADPTVSTNPGSSGEGGAGGTSSTVHIPAGEATSTDMPAGGWGSPISTVPILPEHDR